MLAATTESLVVEDIGRLYEVSTWIHARVFRTRNVKFDSSTGTLEIPFERELEELAEVARRSLFGRNPVRWRVPLARSVLRIHHVLEWRIDDRARAGTQLLDKVSYEPERGLVVVASDVELTITARVSRLTVTVDDTDDRVGARSFTE